MPNSRKDSLFLNSDEARRAFLQAMPDIMFIQNFDGIYLDYHAPEASLLLHPPDIFIGKSMQEVLPSDLFEKFYKIFKNVIATNQLSIFEYSLEFGDKKNYFEIRLNKYDNDKILSIVRDITDRVNAEYEKNHKIEFIDLITRCSSKIIRAKEGELDETINYILAEIGSFTKVNRSYVFQMLPDNAGLTNTYEWCSPNTEPQIEFLREVPNEAIPAWMKTMHAGENAIFNDISAMPIEWLAEKEILQLQDVKSVLAIPIIDSHELKGCIGFDAVDKHVVWNLEEVNLLRILADNLCAFFDRAEYNRKLKESEANYRDIFENIVDVYFKIDTNGILLDISPSVFNVTGYYRQEVLGKDAFEFFKINDSKNAMLNRLNVSGYFNDYPIIVTSKNGNQIYLSANVSIVKDNHGNIQHIQGMLRDISERIEREQQINKLASAIAQSPASVMITDKDGNIEYVNPIFTEYTGYTPEEVIGKKPSILKSGMMEDSIYNDLWSTISEGKIWKGEFINSKKNGELLWETNYISPILDINKNVTNFVSVNIDITDRILAEEESKRNIGLITSLLDSIPDLIFYKDLDGIYIGCNPPFAEFAGLAREDIIGKSDFELFADEVAKEFRKMDYQVLSKNTPMTTEEWVDYPNGEKVLLETLKTPYRDKNYNLIGLLGISRNATDRKKQENILEETRLRLELAMDAGEHGFWDWNLETNSTYFSSVYYTMLGYENQELPMHLDTFNNLIHPDDKISTIAIVEPSIKTGRAYEVEFRLKCKNGNYKWISGKGKSYFSNETGQPNRVVGVHIDIDARKRAENALVESEARIRSIIDTAPTGIATCKSDAKIIMLNKSLTNLIGSEFKELSGQLLSNFIPELENYFDTYTKEYIHAPSTSNELPYNFETTLINLQNKEIPIYLSLSTYLSNDQIVFVITMQDLTLLKKTQIELIQSEKMASLGRLMAGIAHEINTPFGALKSATESLQDAILTFRQNNNVFFGLFSNKDILYILDSIYDHFTIKEQFTTKEERAIKRKLLNDLESRKIDNLEDIVELLISIGIEVVDDKFVDIIANDKTNTNLYVAKSYLTVLQSTDIIKMAVDRSTKIIYALRNYSHFDNSNTPIKSDIISGIETVLTLYQNLTKRGVEIVKNYEKIQPIFCFPDELNQVWTNLIHNSLDAMKYKGKLIVNVSQIDEFILIKIIDDGSGIPKNHYEHLFDPFFTTKNIGEGTGLGLDIAKRIIERHKGKIEFDSEVGVGTEFRVYLPINLEI